MLESGGLDAARKHLFLSNQLKTCVKRIRARESPRFKPSLTAIYCCEKHSNASDIPGKPAPRLGSYKSGDAPIRYCSKNWNYSFHRPILIIGPSKPRLVSVNDAFSPKGKHVST